VDCGCPERQQQRDKIKEAPKAGAKRGAKEKEDDRPTNREGVPREEGMVYEEKPWPKAEFSQHLIYHQGMMYPVGKQFEAGRVITEKECDCSLHMTYERRKAGEKDPG
jgi:hypothetical protein